MSDFDDKKATMYLLIIIALLGIITFNKDNVGMSVIQFGIEEKNFEIQNNEINLNSLTLRQKIGQMIFSLGVNENKDLLQKMNIGGIYLWQKNNEDEFKNDIQNRIWRSLFLLDWI